VRWAACRRDLQHDAPTGQAFFAAKWDQQSTATSGDRRDSSRGQSGWRALGNVARDRTHGAGLRDKWWRWQRVTEPFDVLHLQDKHRDGVRAPTTAPET
jgi:hypothetical protein